MAATVRFGGVEATIDGWRWRCPWAALERLLNAMLDPEGPAGGDPAPDVHAAERAAEVLGGELVQADEVEHVRGRVYS